MVLNAIRYKHWFAAFSDISRIYISSSLRRICCDKFYTVGPNGKMQFRHLLDTPSASALCVFGESVFL